ncbi:hypothetical protein WCU67_20115, partial [Pectobacterium parmentieri]
MKVTLCDAGAYSFYEISLSVNEMFTHRGGIVAKTKRQKKTEPPECSDPKIVRKATFPLINFPKRHWPTDRGHADAHSMM